MEDLKKTLRKYARTIQCVRRLAPCSRVEIANALGLSWTAAYKHTEALIEAGVLRETSDHAYDVVPDLLYSAGIAIGTRSIKVSIIDFAFQLVQCRELDKLGLERLLEDATTENDSVCYASEQDIDRMTDRLSKIVEIILDAFDQNGKTLFGITIAFPGAVDIQQQKIIACPNIGCLAGKQISSLLPGNLLNRIAARETALLVEHNAKAALIAEREHLYHDEDPARRALANKANVVVVYGGTGLGCGISMNYQLLRGSRFAGELGHLTAPDYRVPPEQSTWDGEQAEQVVCSCSHPNCLEALIRARVFGARKLSAYIERTDETILRAFQSEHEPEYRVFLQYVSYIINHFVNLLDVDALIFTGRLFEKMDGFADQIPMLKGKHALSYTAETCSVLLGWSRSDIAAIGAAMEAFLSNGEPSATIEWQNVNAG